MSMQQIILVILIIVFILLVFGIIFYRRKRARTNQTGIPSNQDLSHKQIYVGNLSYQITEQELKEYFNQFGTISQVRVVKNRSSGRSKGFGFVTFINAESANKALVTHGRRYQGRTIVVRIAKPR